MRVHQTDEARVPHAPGDRERRQQAEGGAPEEDRHVEQSRPVVRVPVDWYEARQRHAVRSRRDGGVGRPLAAAVAVVAGDGGIARGGAKRHVVVVLAAGDAVPRARALEPVADDGGGVARVRHHRLLAPRAGAVGVEVVEQAEPRPLRGPRRVPPRVKGARRRKERRVAMVRVQVAHRRRAVGGVDERGGVGGRVEAEHLEDEVLDEAVVAGVDGGAEARQQRAGAAVGARVVAQHAAEAHEAAHDVGEAAAVRGVGEGVGDGVVGRREGRPERRRRGARRLHPALPREAERLRVGLVQRVVRRVGEVEGLGACVGWSEAEAAQGRLGSVFG